MENYLVDVEEQLNTVKEQYNQIIISKQFDYANWRENVKLLSPIVDKLQMHAKERMDNCQREMAVKENTQNELISKRVQLFDKLSGEKSQMSDLDVERIKIGEEIRSLSQEVEDINREIANLQQKIANAKKEKEYWDTVFWATCWIPFANIGTGVKKGQEDGKYYAQVKVCEEDGQRKRNRIEELTNQSRTIVIKQKQNGESSSKLADQITATGGQISEVTNVLNTLRQETALWHNILAACMEIEVELQHTNGKIERVMECFYHLVEVGDLLAPPATDKFIRGCVCKGDMLSVGERLNQNEYLLSNNRRFVLVMQADNNLVMYNSEKALWDTRTWGAQGKGCVELDTDGLVSLKGTNKSWDTKRAGAAVLIMQDDGNLVTYDKDRNTLWASDTYIYANAPGICFNKL